MLRYAVLVVRLEHTTDHVGIVSVCPHSRIGDVLGKILLWPEELGGSIIARATVGDRGQGRDRSRGRGRWLGLEEGFEEASFIRRRVSCVFDARVPAILPCASWMSSNAVHEDDAA